MRHLLIISILLLFVTAPVAAQPQIKLTTTQRTAMGIEVDAIQPAEDVPLDGLSATVRAPLQESAVVTAPLAGTIVEILAREGELVRRGQTLARIQSREAMSLAADLTAARGELDVARAQATRDQQLLDEGIIPASRAQATIAHRDAAAARFQELQAVRSMAPQATGATPGTYELRAPIDGRVIERSLRLGEPIDALAKAFVVAEPGRVMLEIQVPSRYAGQVRPGMRIRAGDGATGILNEIGVALDHASQTVLVRANMESEALLPGQQISATLLLPAPDGAWILPSAAVAEHEGERFVFVEQTSGFEPVSVTVLAQTGDGQSVVAGLLSAHDRVVVVGTGALKAMLAAGE